MANPVSETLKQLLEGRDFAPPRKLLNIDAKRACEVIEGAPYSIATNVLHADLWQRIWLARLKGEKRPTSNVFKDDWRVAGPEEWPEIRDRFLAGLEDALAIARSEPFSHAIKEDEGAIKVLNEIALHNAYHMGQVALLKRIMRKRRGETEPAEEDA